MKITKEQLKRIVKEELSRIFNEEMPSSSINDKIDILDTILTGSDRGPGLFTMLAAGVDANFASALRHLEEFVYDIEDRNIQKQVNEFRRQLLEDKEELAAGEASERKNRMLAISIFGRQKWRNIKTSIRGT